MSIDNIDIVHVQADHDENEDVGDRQATPVIEDGDREHVDAQEEPGEECEGAEVIDPEAEEEFERQRVAIAPEIGIETYQVPRSPRCIAPCATLR